MDSVSPLYFLHIPKTSGTTLTRYVDSHFAEDDILPPKVWNHHLPELEWRQRTAFVRSMDRYELVRGHFGLGVWRELGPDPVYITMLRDPIEKTLSMFHHIDTERIHNNFVHPDFYREPFSLEDVLGDGRGALFRNHQVRHLAVDLNVKRMANGRDRQDHATMYFDSLPQFVTPGIDDEELLERAWRNLQRFAFFGLQEHHQAGVLLLADTMGWKPVAVQERLMTHGERPTRADLPAPVIAAIEDGNALDRQLLDRARRLFFARYAALATRWLGLEVDPEQARNEEPDLTERVLSAMTDAALR